MQVAHECTGCAEVLCLCIHASLQIQVVGSACMTVVFEWQQQLWWTTALSLAAYAHYAVNTVRVK